MVTSRIWKDTPLALQVTKGSKKLFTVKPLREEKKATAPAPAPTSAPAAEARPPAPTTAREWVDTKISQINACTTIERLQAITGAQGYINGLRKIANTDAAMHAELTDAASKKAASLADDAAPDDAPFDEETGEIAA